MAVIDMEIETLKIKIVYWRKMVIFQNLRSENASEDLKFYIIIKGDIPPISRKRTQSFPAEISLF
jgi:hypothetical protein